MDASLEMLLQAKRRLVEQGDRGWWYLQGDAFALALRPGFDLVYSLRFIRHFEIEDRLRLYDAITRVLSPEGGWSSTQ